MHHRLISCQTVSESAEFIKCTLQRIIRREVIWKEILSLSYTCRNQRTLKMSIWFVVRGLHMIFSSSHSNKDDLISEMLAEIRANDSLNIFMGCKEETYRLQTILELLQR